MPDTSFLFYFFPNEVIVVFYALELALELATGLVFTRVGLDTLSWL
jgi:hypothetical protein